MPYLKIVPFFFSEISQNCGTQLEGQDKQSPGPENSVTHPTVHPEYHNMCMDMPTYMSPYTTTNMHTYVYAHAWVHKHMPACIYTCVHAWMWVCMFIQCIQALACSKCLTVGCLSLATARPSGSAWQSPPSWLHPRNNHNGAFFVEQISNEITGYCPGSKDAGGLHAVALGRTSSSPASSVPKETDLNSLTSKLKLWKWNQMHVSPPGLLENAILIPKRVTRA